MTLAASVNQGRLLPKGVAYNRMFFMGVTGLTLTVTISKNGAAFGALAGTVAEVSVGWYKAAITSGDTDTEGDLAFHATDGGANIEDWCDQVAAPVKMADGVAHGGTPGSSTATLSFSRMVGQSQSADTPAFSMIGNGTGVGGLFQGGSADASGLVGLGGGVDGSGIVALAAGKGDNGSNSGILAIGGADSGNGMTVLAANGPALRVRTTAGNPAALFDGAGVGPGITVSSDSDDALLVVSAGVGKHDINLNGSGDIWDSVKGRPVQVLSDRVMSSGTLGDQSAGSVDDIILPSGPGTNNVLIGSRLRIYSGVGQYQERTIIAWNGTTKEATVDVPWTGVLPTIGDLFHVLYDHSYTLDSEAGNVYAISTVAFMTPAALAQFFTLDTTKVYADAVAGSVVKAISDNANVKKVNSVTVTGTGASGNEWGP